MIDPGFRTTVFDTVRLWQEVARQEGITWNGIEAQVQFLVSEVDFMLCPATVPPDQIKSAVMEALTELAIDALQRRNQQP